MRNKLIILATVLSLFFIAAPAHASPDALAINAAWNSQLADGDLTYKVSAPNSTVQSAIQSATEDWDTNLPLSLTPTSAKTPNISIKFKKGGGQIQGLARYTFTNGFISHVEISISGQAFGSQNSLDIIKQITRHEVGHALGLGHADFSGDLMSTSLSNGWPLITQCDIDGVFAAQHWKLVDSLSTPHQPHVSSVSC